MLSNTAVGAEAGPMVMVVDDHDGCCAVAEVFSAILESRCVLGNIDNCLGHACFVECSVGHRALDTRWLAVHRHHLTHDRASPPPTIFLPGWQEKSIATVSAGVPGRGIPEHREDMPRKPGPPARKEATMIRQTS